ncbi:MAG: hypothetical protein V1745_00725 [Patescibacteria group bacterium]
MSPAPKVLVASGCAGDADVVSAYIKRHRDEKTWICHASGAAIKPFTRKGVPFMAYPDDADAEALLERCGPLEMVIANPSWSSSFETDLIRAAKARGIPTVSYLDHWVNYRERFLYPHEGWERNLPDELWVGDSHAVEIAQRDFSGRTVRLVPNQAFVEMKEEFAEAMRKITEDPQAILFVSEPIDSGVNALGDMEPISFTETEVLEAVIGVVVRHAPDRRLIIRLHPAEPRGKFDAVVAASGASLDIRVSDGRTLCEDIASAPVVVGVETMALAAVVICGKRAISVFLDESARCRLPFPEIVKLKNAEELADYL